MTTKDKWRVLIADDEPIARRGVRQLLAAFPEFCVVGECRDGREVLAALAAGDGAKAARIAETRLGLRSPGAAACNPAQVANTTAMEPVMRITTRMNPDVWHRRAGSP